MESNNKKVIDNAGISSYTNQTDGFDFKYVVAKVVGNWKGFALSLVLCLAFGILYILFGIPTFTITARVMVNGDNANKIQSGVSESDILSKLGVFSQQNDVNNELVAIHSRTLIEQAIHDLQMNVSYWAQGEIRFAEVYKRSPFFIDLLELKGGLENPLAWDVRIDKDKVKFIDDYTDTSFVQTWGDTVKLRYCTFVLKQNPEVTVRNPNLPLGLRIAPFDATFFTYNESLLAFLSALSTTSMDITFDASVPKKGEDFVNYLISLYVKSKIDASNMVADSTVSFIDERIQMVARELSNVEGSIQKFQQSNSITDINALSSALIGQKSDAGKELSAQEVQIQWVQDLEAVLQDDKRPMPTVSPITDQAYIQLVEKYNNLQQQRQLLLTNNTEQNPQVKAVDGQLAQIRNNLVKTLVTYRQGLVVKRDDLAKQNSSVQAAIQKMPVQQRQYLESSRRQDVLQQLYVYLLTVREQTAVTKSNNIAPVRILDVAKAGVYPWWPNKLIVIIGSIFLGLLIPSLVILINELTNNKVTTPADIVESTSAPLIAEISETKSSNKVVVTKESRTAVAEQFRTLRTNLLFRLSGTDQKVIMITSTVSGEGKSFITLNLAAAMALSGKKVLLVDMELRKAQLTKDLGLQDHTGIADYLERSAFLNDVIQPSGINENLWVLSSGELESNPSETLLNDKMGAFFDEMKRKFDYIILDTPPAAIVTDAQVIGRYADVTLYIVRQKVTYKKHIDVIEDLKQNNKLKNISVILNDVKLVPGYNQGYGFGYRFDEDFGYYTQEDVTEKKSFFKRLFPEG
ncbi:GumC family protein [Limnovirga soli]|uniref:Polysaccharide biosynthesis tyrosine autokinase n=1 Tax=Limnovirga soli TaxID=2656915 RepID=A0A8J8JSX3_9BACT|nr:polysaccharide biosynthesis tyrosine autokinase [Limnovirga soli]NNV57452.1 polysaccharide biosynthesis tyrosine autokinase [Limnovirga soli]